MVNHKTRHLRPTICKKKMSQDSQDNNNTSPRETNNTSTEQTQHWGDLPEEKHQSDCRIAFQNINGLSQYHIKIQGNELAQKIHKLQADIVGLAETNLNWQFKNTKQQAKMSLNLPDTKTMLVTSNLQKLTKTAYQPGGTACLLRDPWTGRIKSTTTDHLGR